ncbi:PAS domain S-box protein [Catenovulum sp. 2E275]|uniref:PAS domain S-box protein n=1 Tax=Catenovulum sp. 2E275 TaxID=2980497 RepID=UPI0021D23576|nr:PAS domain S-box protein [Catenovulum sp. 2E275]MCU4675582.1 PAS domain S-box protein [Catenovulum sp. 2E275]
MNTVGRWFFLCFLIGVTCLLGFSYLVQSHLTDYFRQEKQQLMLAQAGLVDSQIQDLIQQEIQELGIWTSHPLVFEFAKKQVANTQEKNSVNVSISEMHYFAFLIENGVLADPSYQNSYLFSPDGELIWSAEGTKDDYLFNHPGFDDWLHQMQQGFAGGLIVTSKPVQAQHTEFDYSVSSYFGVPLIEQGKIIAVLTLSLNVKPRFLNILKNARLSADSNVVLFDKYNQEILSLEFDTLTTSVIHRNLVDATGNPEKIFEIKDKMFARQWNNKFHYGVVLSTPKASINESLEKIQSGIAIIVFFAVAVMLALLLVITVSKNKLKAKQLNILRHRTRLLHVQDLSQVACIELTLYEQKLIWHSGFEFIYALFPDEVNSPASLFSKLPSSTKDEFFVLLNKIKKYHQNEEMEFYYEMDDGEKKYLSVKFFPQVLDENQTILVLISDITSQKLQQKAAIEKEKEYRDLIIQSAHDGIISVDLAGYVTLYNQASLNMLGYSEQELKQTPIQSLLFETENASNSKIKQISGTAKAWFACQDGSRLPVDCRVSSIVQNGEVVGFVYLFRDISDQIEFENKLKASEQRFRRVIEGTSDATFDWDMVHNHLHWNARYWEILGYEKEHAQLLAKQDNHKWDNAIHKSDVDRFINLVQAHLVYGDPFDLEFRAVRLDQTEVWLRARGQAIKEADKFVYLSGTISDISQIKQAEHEKTVLESQLRHAQKMEAIGQLTGGIAHDFNNILASILGYAELVSDTIDMGRADRVPPYLEQIIQSGERARDLIKQMMVFSRKDTQRLKDISAEKLMSETKAIIRPLIPSSIDMIFINKADALLTVDPVQFQQLLINLAINAKDAVSDKGWIKVESEIVNQQIVTCSSCHENAIQDYLRIKVSDNGKGISADNLKKIFDPYFTSKGLGEGTGMGLSIVHGIVHQLGGHIQVESEPMKGSCFELFLPFKPLKYVVKTNDSSFSKDYPEVVHSQSNIFIIDDEEAIAKLIAKKLTLKGYQAQFLCDSEQAYQYLANTKDKVDLIITDQTMPNLSGLELAKKLFAKGINLPVILCTGYSANVNEVTARAAGIYAYLEKPIKFSQLEVLIERALAENSENLQN